MNTMNIEAMVYEVVGASESWASTLDRSVLGSFSVDEEILILTHAYMSSSESFSGDDTYPPDVGSALIKRISEADKRVRAEFPDGGRMNSYEAYAELFMWWAEQGVYANARALETYEYTNRDAAFLTKVARHPERLAYYEAGLRDDDFIDRCVADDIDVSMVTSLGALASV